MLKLIGIIFAVAVLSWVPSLIRNAIVSIKIWWARMHAEPDEKWMY
jgi:hypothetical protein